MRDLGIYLHWPYCKSKCPYCDFFSKVERNINQDNIIDGYLKQLEKYHQLLKECNIKSVFFGGGTPSLIEPYNIEKIINKINKLWGLDDVCEISLEANPNTNKGSLFTDLCTAGINRLSLGVQSLDDNELKFLGRTHNSQKALKAIDDMQKVFANCSIDLMYALPNQIAENWLKQLQYVCNLELKHISLYQLTIEEGTVFARKKIKPLDEEKAAELYLMSEDILSQNGIYKYEVSNYAAEGRCSQHNLIYWQGGEYIGIGKSAHGRIKINNEWFAQTDNLQLEKIDAKERAEELIIMGMRLTKGINKDLFQDICGIEFDNFVNQKFLNSAVEQKLLINDKENISATKDGFLVLDKLIEGICC